MRNPRATILIGLLIAMCVVPGARALHEPPALSRIAVMGASMSDGFGVRVSTTLEDGRKVSQGVNLSDMVKISCKDPSALVKNYTSSLYFMNPAQTARSSARRALGSGKFDMPTCVLAVDWLFWNGYGTRNVRGENISKDLERMELLDNALVCLEPFCEAGIPLVLGDFPDMHSAIGGGMISAPMVPSVECLKALNARLAQWAGGKKNVRIVALSTLTEDLLRLKPIHAAGRDWREQELGPLLQKDRLHPTFAGTVVVLAAALEALDSKSDQVPLKQFEIDPTVLRQRFVERLKFSASKDGKKDADAPAASGAAPSGSTAESN